LVEQSSIDQWRSNTLSALTAHQDFKQEQVKDTEAIFARIKEAILPWLPDSSAFARNESKFRRDILDPAVRVHRAMRTSTHWYEMIYPRLPEGTVSGETLNESYNLKDFGTWREVSNNNEVKNILNCLHPAIVRFSAENDEEVKLVKPVILVTLTTVPFLYQSLSRSATGDSKELQGEPDSLYMNHPGHSKRSKKGGGKHGTGNPEGKTPHLRRRSSGGFRSKLSALASGLSSASQTKNS
jgi:hypothetical protein